MLNPHNEVVHFALSQESVEIAQVNIHIDVPLQVVVNFMAAKAVERHLGVIAHEATRTCGFGAELMSLVQEHCFHYLEAPIERVTGWDTPYPHAQEWAYFPGPARVGRPCRPMRLRFLQGKLCEPIV